MALTDGDKRMLLLGRRENKGFHHATRWYFRGWTPLDYQWAAHQAEIMNFTFVAGIATGKTIWVGASYLMDCITIPHFRALNTAVTAKQAELPFEMIMSWVDGNYRLEHLIEDIKLRPYPIITFKNFSRYDFRTAGQDARFIRGFEYDRGNYDEAGLDYLGTTPKILRGRLRGTRPDGTQRMARFDVTTSPTAAQWLRERFFRGIKSHPLYNPDLYLSLRKATWDNPMLPEEQIEAMKAEYPPDLLDVEMGGLFPDYGMSLFPTGHITACIDQSLYDAAYLALNPEDTKDIPKKGYSLYEDPRHGIFHFEAPPQPGRLYIVGGDPGTDVPPKRNTAVVVVADVTSEPYKLVYFDWVVGKGSYNPFLRSYKYALDVYKPLYKGIDATGTQKGIDELAFENVGIETDKINFGSDKDAMVNSHLVAITNHLWKYPPIKGWIDQHSMYVRQDKDLAQDIVMASAQISYLARFMPKEIDQNAPPPKANYVPRNARSSARTGRQRKRYR